MLDQQIAALAGDDLEWAERCEHWVAGAPRPAKRTRRERNTEPLILTGHGVSLRIDNGSLLIRDGFTHYPQKQREFRFFRSDLALPPRIVVLDGSGSISFDVLSWLAEQNVPLIRIDWRGNVVAVVSGSGFAADRDKVRWQEETRGDEEARVEFSAELVRRKLANSITTLNECLDPSASRNRALALAEKNIAQLRAKAPETISDLRLAESMCAQAYFRAWTGLTLNWVGTSRKPIPNDWRRFTSRVSLANGRKTKNQNASHPLNAMLNYAYGALQGRLQIRAAAEGYDPTIGVMHQGRRGAPAFAFDLMEPERPVVDRSILRFVSESAFHAADFTIRPGGVCRMNPEAARPAVASVSRRDR